MKKLAPVPIVVLLLWTACSSQEKASSPNENEKVEAASQDRKQYQAAIEAKLRELDQEIETLKAKAAKQGKQARKQLDQQLADLDQKRGVAQQDLEEFKKSGKLAWRDMKPGIDAAMKDLEVAYKRAASHFN